jgi:hypothetical protein
MRQIRAAIDIPRRRPRSSSHSHHNPSQPPVTETESFVEGVEKIADAVGVPRDHDLVKKIIRACRDGEFKEAFDMIVDLADRFRGKAEFRQLPTKSQHEFESCLRELAECRDEFAS